MHDAMHPADEHHTPDHPLDAVATDDHLLVEDLVADTVTLECTVQHPGVFTTLGEGTN